MATTTDIGTTNILDVDGSYYGDHAGDYDHDEIRSDYRDAIQAVLPEGVHLALNGQLLAELEVADEARAIDWAEIEEQVDFDAIAERHDLTAEHTIETDVLNDSGSWETVDRERGTRKAFDMAEVSADDIGGEPGQRLRLRLVEDDSDRTVLAERYITTS